MSSYHNMSLRHLLFLGWRQSPHQGIPETRLVWTVWLCVCPSRRHPISSLETPAAADATHTDRKHPHVQLSHTIMPPETISSTQSQRRGLSVLVPEKHTNRALCGKQRNMNKMSWLSKWGEAWWRTNRQSSKHRKGKCDIKGRGTDWNVKQSGTDSVIARHLFLPPFFPHWLHFKKLNFTEGRTCRG